MEALNQAPFLWIPHLGQPDPYYILLVLYVVTQMISTELMVATQSDQTQKWIMRAMPIMFVLFLFNFPAGLFVYWVTTNVWTIGQQLIIKRTMPKPEELAAKAKAKPKKRSRFMEAMMASQCEAMKQREQKMAQKGEGGGASKQGSVAAGKKPAHGGKKPPPGKAKRKQVAGRQARPAGGREAQGRRRPAGQAAPGRPAAQEDSAGRQAGRRRARAGRRRRNDHERGRSGGRVTPPGPPTPFPPDQGAGSMEEPDDLQPIDEDEEETEFATIAGGATIEEAKRTALEQLRKIVPYVNPEDVEYVVVEEGSKGGLFGRGKMLAQVEARLLPV